MGSKKLHHTILPPPNVVLVGIIHQREKKINSETHLEELGSLAHTAGMCVVKTFTQKLDAPVASTLIGSGKVEEIGVFIKENDIQRVICDDELTPTQAKNLEKAWGCEVWDRSLLILDVFAVHARTPQAKAQVELAQYQYLLPRLAGMWSHLSRQKGGKSTMRGPGEKELETDRRLAQQRITFLKQKLAKIEQTGKTQRKQRHEKMNITLVGYTNAGKSSLMQRLSKEQVFVADKLFATLSPTVRKIRIKDRVFLLADTVGFIHKLPHTLIACFKSTLAEVREADLLLHVVDVAHPNYDHHIQVVHQVLQEVEAAKVPTILVMNKQDRIIKQYEKTSSNLLKNDPNVFMAAEKERISSKYDVPVIGCSALTKEGIDKLTNTIYRCLNAQ